MFQINPEQLKMQVSENLNTAYLLLGNDPFLLQESYNLIKEAAILQGFKEHYNFYINKNTNWQDIFSLCRSINLFSIRQTMQLFLPENDLTININKYLAKLVNLLHNDLILIMRSNKLNKTQKKSAWFTVLSPNLILVTCSTPEKTELLNWINLRAKNNSLQFDDKICQLLCYYYEGNLLALAQIIEIFSLIWKNSKIDITNVKCIINDVAHFTPFHWVYAILMANSKRALHILQQLRIEGNDPVILLRTFQHELLLIVKFKRQLANTPIQSLFDKYHIWQYTRKVAISKALSRLNEFQLRYSVYFLNNIELSLKQDYDELVWNKLEDISLFICHNTLIE